MDGNYTIPVPSRGMPEAPELTANEGYEWTGNWIAINRPNKDVCSHSYFATNPWLIDLELEPEYRPIEE